MIKTLITLTVLATLNIQGVAAHEAVKPVEVKQLDLKRELRLQGMRQQLPQIVKKVTQRAYKTPYVFSGSTIYGWDCSGLVRYVYKQLGVVLPHSADKQAHIGKRVSKPKVGDIVVFAYQGSTEFYHSAIYLGDGLIVNANREYGTTVIQPLSNFSKSQIRFVRVL